MAKGSSLKVPSKTQIAKENRHYRAQDLVRDAMCDTPQYKTAVRVAERQLAKVEGAVRSAVVQKIDKK